MSEDNDYDPGPWAGHDFGSARKVYDDHAGRSYDDAVNSNKTAADLLPASISTDSDSPLIILSDVTGSMGEWPATIFGKLAYLDKEIGSYLGQGAEILFGAIGDTTCDSYPLQMRPFSKGLDLEKQLLQLVIEGHGGGQTTESYEHGALYVSRNVHMPNAVRRPIVIFIGDEQPYNSVSPSSARTHAKVSLESSMSDKQIFAELMNKCSVYLIQKPYHSYQSSINEDIKSHWVSLLGEDRIAELPGPDRVLDVIFGILAADVNKIDYYHDEMEHRQKPHQIQEAYRSLATIHSSVIAKHSGKSSMFVHGTGEESRSLLGD